MKQCERCGKPTNAYKMSVFNLQDCCVACIAEERLHPQYKEAVMADEAEIAKGNFNFPGIGLPADLAAKYATTTVDRPNSNLHPHAEQLVQLAYTYAKIADKYMCRDADYLRRVTYKLRESTAPHLPYLATGTTGLNYYPQPTRKQKSWQWLYDQSLVEALETVAGYLALWVEQNADGTFRISVIQSKGKGRRVDRVETVLFSVVVTPPTV